MASSSCGDSPCFICRRRVSTRRILGSSLTARGRAASGAGTRPRLGVLPGFQRRRGGPQHDRNVQIVGRHTARSRAPNSAVRPAACGRDRALRRPRSGPARSAGRRSTCACPAACAPGRAAARVQRLAARSPSDRPLCITASPLGADQRFQARAAARLRAARQIDFGDQQQHLPPPAARTFSARAGRLRSCRCPSRRAAAPA